MKAKGQETPADFRALDQAHAKRRDIHIVSFYQCRRLKIGQGVMVLNFEKVDLDYILEINSLL